MNTAMKALLQANHTLIMGVLNITEDSFSDGGQFLDTEVAKSHALQMVHDGAAIVDIGGESTRPGAKRVDEDTELQRVLAPLSALTATDVAISIDTTRSVVAERALAAGANIINDISGGTLDPRLPNVVAEYGCPYIVQHFRGWLAGGTAGVPDADTSYYDNGVVADVVDELMHQVDRVIAAGVQPEQIIVDPGLGFSKPTVDHNLPLLRSLDRLQAYGYPVLIGASRKRFIAQLITNNPHIDGEFSIHDNGILVDSMDLRDEATAAITALCASQGVWGVRVHNVPDNVIAARIGTALRG